MPDQAPHAYLKRGLVWRMVHVATSLFTHSWLRLSVTGRENIDNTRGGILLFNHQSFLDPLLAAVRLSRPVSYLARDSLFVIPVVGWILRNTYVTPLNRTAFRGSSIRQALERLESGFLVGVFPEGTRTPDGEVKAFRPGFLSLVRRSDVPIYPVGISGADKAMPRGAWFVRPARITIHYGAPLTAAECEQLRENRNEKAAAELARQRVMENQLLAAKNLSTRALT
ncbi:MAG: lysophospholipid acyltransferase family protein [Planctomycetaceae bacterium]